MRHKKARGRLSRFSSHRKATLKSLVRNLIVHESIKTTLSKAKEAKRTADKLISLGKQNTLYARRQAYRLLEDRGLVQTLFGEIAPRFKARQGGYTRLIRSFPRKGDNAGMAILELTERALEVLTEKKPKPKEEKPSAEKAKPPIEKPKEFREKPKPVKKPKGFLRDLRSFFKKERDSL